jgi:hypothetical protein
MDYNFWVPLTVNVIGLYLSYRQVKLGEAQLGAAPSPKFISIGSIKRYWPMAAMTVLMLACWIPYFLNPQPIPDRFMSYGMSPSKISALLKTTDLFSKRPDRLMLIARIWDGSVPEETDRQTVRSATFEIGEDSTSMQINLTPEEEARLSRSGPVEIIVLEVPKDLSVELVKSVSDAEKLGAKRIGKKAFGSTGPIR